MKGKLILITLFVWVVVFTLFIGCTNDAVFHPLRKAIVEPVYAWDKILADSD